MLLADPWLHDSEHDRLLGGGVCRAALGAAVGTGRSAGPSEDSRVRRCPPAADWPSGWASCCRWPWGKSRCGDLPEDARAGGNPHLLPRPTFVSPPHVPGLLHQSGKLWELLAGGTVLMLLGLADDRRGLDWRLRLGVQTAVAVVLVSLGWRMSLFLDWLTCPGSPAR